MFSESRDPIEQKFLKNIKIIINNDLTNLNSKGTHINVKKISSMIQSP